MRTLLALEVSPRRDRSISRALGKRFVEDWQARNPDGTVIHRDINAPRFVLHGQRLIAGVNAPADVQRTPRCRRALPSGPTDRKAPSCRCALD
jgi:FMN-dependent NADH-azoreductase